jgi:RNA polymerase sigma factor (sigma-70 family)
MVTPNLLPTDAASLPDRVRRAVARWVRWGRLPAHEFEDHVQEVLAGVLYRLARRRSPRTDRWVVARRAIESTLSNVRRHRLARRRAPPRAVSVELSPAWADPRTAGGWDEAAWRLDIADALRGLPADLHELADYLKRYTLSEVARLLGTSRSTLRRRLAKIRRRFERLGLMPDR